MIKIETGCETIFKYDNVLDCKTCTQLYDYIMSLNPSLGYDNNIMPWFENNTFNWNDILDLDLRKKIEEYREIINKLVNETYNKIYQLEFTDIVLWNENKSMPLHKDNGYNEFSNLKLRKITTVTYINDDFIGGETFIKNETGKDYISKPKTGSIVMLLSDETNSHGVNKILCGKRLTLPMWFK